MRFNIVLHDVAFREILEMNRKQKRASARLFPFFFFLISIFVDARNKNQKIY